MSDKIPRTRTGNDNIFHTALFASSSAPQPYPQATPPVMRSPASTHGSTASVNEWIQIQRQFDKLNQLKRAATTNHFDTLPFEIKSHIFAYLGNDIDITSRKPFGLHAFANTSRGAFNDVVRFLHEMKSGRAIFDEYRYAQPEQWQKTAAYLKHHATDIRQAFRDSTVEVTSMLQAGTPVGLMLDYLSDFPGIELDFTAEIDTQAMMDLVAALRDKPIKLNACSVGRDVVLNALMPVLSTAHPSCPLIVDLSCNLLDPSDLGILADWMRSHPSVYQLNLSENYFSDNFGFYEDVVDLFTSLGPVTHLQLANNGINNETAAAIKPVLAANTHLTYLDLSGNHLMFSGLSAIIDAVAEPSHLPQSSYRYNKTLEAVYLGANPSHTEPFIALRVYFAHLILNSEIGSPFTDAELIQGLGKVVINLQTPINRDPANLL